MANFIIKIGQRKIILVPHLIKYRQAVSQFTVAAICVIHTGTVNYFLGGAETATHAGGYLEGALDAATRLVRMLSPNDLLKTLNADNNASLSHFGSWLSTKRSHVLAHYRSHLNRYMTLQLKEQLTQRALLDTVEQIYSEAIEKLNSLPLNTRDVTIDKGRSALTPVVLSHFNGINQDLVETA